MNIKIAKALLKAKNLLETVHDKIIIDNHPSPIQEMGLDLWKEFVNDEKSELTSSIRNKYRYINRGDISLFLKPLNAIDFVLTIMENSNKNFFYTINYSEKNSINMINQFEDENERRMNIIEQKGKDTILTHLTSLKTSL